MVYINLHDAQDGAEYGLDSDDISLTKRESEDDFTTVFFKERMDKMLPASLQVQELPSSIASEINLAKAQMEANVRTMIEDIATTRENTRKFALSSRKTTPYEP